MNEELLFNEIYEKTKDCGRTQFVRLLMDKERENKELKEQLEEKNTIYYKSSKRMFPDENSPYTIDMLPMHKDTYFFGYGIDIDKPIEMANRIIYLKEKYKKALELLAECNLPCEIDEFNTKEELENKEIKKLMSMLSDSMLDLFRSIKND